MARPVVLLLAIVLLGCAACALASPAPFRGSVGPNGGSPNIPGVSNPGPGRHGEVSGGIRRDKGYGTTVHGAGSGDAWVSRDGNSRVNVGGRVSQGVSGHAKGQRDYGGHIMYEKKW